MCYISANHGELTFHCNDRSYNTSSYQQQLKKKAQKQPLLIVQGLASSIDSEDNITAKACHITF